MTAFTATNQAAHRNPVAQQCERCRHVLRHRAPWMQMTFCPSCIHAGYDIALTPILDEDNAQGPRETISRVEADAAAAASHERAHVVTPDCCSAR